MRRVDVLTILAVVCLTAFGVRAGSAVSTPAAGRAPRAADRDGPAASWDVEGTWMKTREEAEQDALAKARELMVAHLRQLDPPVEWAPPPADLKRLVKSFDEEARDFEGPVGVMRRVRLRVELPAAELSALRQQDREHRMGQRMLGLAKVLGGLVVFLAVVAGYVRLDERTKGYYTNWLRLTAVAVVAAAGAGLWWLS